MRVNSEVEYTNMHCILIQMNCNQVAIEVVRNRFLLAEQDHLKGVKIKANSRHVRMSK